MKQFIIKSPKVEGEIRVVYNEGQLLKIDFSGARMAPFEIEAFNRKIPARLELLQQSFSEQTKIVEQEIEISLADFKRVYPYSRNMHLLEPIWEKMSKGEQVIAFYAAIDYALYCEQNKAWYNPKIAAAWLKAKEYLNDWKKMMKK